MYDFDWMLKPYRKETFYEEVWQKKPAVLASGRSGYFDHLFSKHAVERIIEFSQPVPPNIKLASASARSRASVPFSPNGRIDVDQLRKFYMKGSTVVLNELEDFDPLVAQLARSIETELGAYVHVNSYLTPPSARGFRAHHDSHDVLVAQIEGTKVWKVYGEDCVCPLNELFNRGTRITNECAPPQEIALEPGDVLYIPRGWAHEAATEESASLHLTFGIRPPLGKALFSAALDELAERHALFSEALPLGALSAPDRKEQLKAHFAKLLDVFSSEASEIEAASTLELGFRRRGRSGGDGHLFSDAEKIAQLAANSVLERRRNMRCRVVQQEDGVALEFLFSTISADASFEDAMHFIVKSETRFRVSDLPGLDLKQQIDLSANLVREGLCRIVEI